MTGTINCSSFDEEFGASGEADATRNYFATRNYLDWLARFVYHFCCGIIFDIRISQKPWGHHPANYSTPFAETAEQRLLYYRLTCVEFRILTFFLGHDAHGTVEGKITNLVDLATIRKTSIGKWGELSRKGRCMLGTCVFYSLSFRR